MRSGAEDPGVRVPQGSFAVVGLSRSGISSARRLAEAGRGVVLIEEILRAEDLDETAQSAVDDLEGLGIDLRFGNGHPGSGRRWIGRDESVVLSPGVSEGAEIVSGLDESRILSEPELAFRFLAERRFGGDSLDLVAITGTNGKTTVTSMMAHVGEACGRQSVACGNIGYPLIDAVCDAADGSLLVAEVSSFQLRFATSFRPDVAVLLNFAPDHLDWHADLDSYSAAKGRLLTNQVKGDISIWNADDSGASGIAEEWLAPEATAVEFTKREPALGAVGMVDGEIVDVEGLSVMRIDALNLPGDHNIENALATVAMAGALGLDRADVGRALATFRPLPHRMQEVASIGGIAFVDDSKATNPHAAASAISAYESVVLIAGGRNKGLDLAGMLDGVDPGRLRAVIAIGEAAQEVCTALGPAVADVVLASSMAVAVDLAAGLAHPGDTVLLSPGCASFDAYPNYAARGDAFSACVAELGRNERGVGR